MKYCQYCGAEITDDAKFCPSCGKATANNEQKSQAADYQKKVEDAVQGFMNTPDETDSYDANDISNNKVLALLSYLGILIIVPLVAAPQSKFAKFHVNQGLVLLISSIVLNIATGVLSTIAFFIAELVGALVSLVCGAAGLVIFVLMIIGIVNAAQGKAKELPLIGKIRLLK